MEKKRYERPLLKRIVPTMPGKTGQNTNAVAQTEIDGVPLEGLRERFGSPLFVFSESRLRKNIREAKQAFSTRYPEVRFAWSYKTNYLNSICSLFHEEGSWAEVVSGFEYDKAIENGVASNRIIFNGPSKSEADLLKAVRGDSLIHIDNTEELRLLTNLAVAEGVRPRVAIRVNLDAGIYPAWSRFGFNLESGQAWDALEKIASENRLSCVGLHCHIGTFIQTVNAYRVETEKMAALALDAMTKLGLPISYLDLGGGFASKNSLKSSYLTGEDLCPSFDDYAEAITSVLRRVKFPGDKKMVLVFETGRALVDNAGFLLSSVITNKRMADGRLNTVIDAGVNLLFTSFWYNHKVTTTYDNVALMEPTTLCGPLCMNIDVIRDNVLLPPLKRNDLVLIHYVGAYNVTQWMQFITMRPKVVMVKENGEVHLLRDAETLADINRMEH